MKLNSYVKDCTRIYYFFSDMSYRFDGRDSCIHLDVAAEELSVLNDDDPSTCEPMFIGSQYTFLGAFFGREKYGSIDIIIRGSQLECSPVFGMSVSVVSVNRQRNSCKVHYSGSVIWCRYACTCTDRDGCSHIIVDCTRARSEVADREICEINFDSLRPSDAYMRR